MAQNTTKPRKTLSRRSIRRGNQTQAELAALSIMESVLHECSMLAALMQTRSCIYSTWWSKVGTACASLSHQTEVRSRSLSLAVEYATKHTQLTQMDFLSAQPTCSPSCTDWLCQLDH